MAAEVLLPEGTPGSDGRGKNYKWIALSNTTLGILMATINSSILLIALPDIFRGIKLNPLAPGNTPYFLWILMGFLLVTSVLVVSLGRIGDIYGRVRMFNLGFAVFTRVLDPAGRHLDDRHPRRAVDRPHAARPGRRRRVPVRQLLRDPHRRLPGERAGHGAGHQRRRRDRRLVPRPDPRRRARAGRVAPGVLVSVPLGLFGTVWSYFKLQDNGVRTPAKIDWTGNAAVRGRAGRRPHRHRLRPAALRRAHDGLDQAVRAGLHVRRARRPGRCSSSSRPGSRTRCSGCTCSGAGRSRWATSPACSPRSPAAGCSSC